jgi:hypothetical protein
MPPSRRGVPVGPVRLWSTHPPSHNRAGLLPASGLGWTRRGHVITEDSDWLHAKFTCPRARHSSQDRTDSFAAPGAPWHRITKCQKSKEAQLARCKVGMLLAAASGARHQDMPCEAAPAGRAARGGEGRLNRRSKGCHKSRPWRDPSLKSEAVPW